MEEKREAYGFSAEVADGNFRGASTSEQSFSQQLFCRDHLVRQSFVVSKLLDKRKNNRHVAFGGGANMKSWNVGRRSHLTSAKDFEFLCCGADRYKLDQGGNLSLSLQRPPNTLGSQRHVRDRYTRAPDPRAARPTRPPATPP